jgi:hypothetical protein
MAPARGAITIRTADGTSIGHGWGEVRISRDPQTGRTTLHGEVWEMTWLPNLPSPDTWKSYRVAFYGGLSFDGVFDPPFPAPERRRATFRPSGPKSVPIGSARTPLTSRFPARLP